MHVSSVKSQIDQTSFLICVIKLSLYYLMTLFRAHRLYILTSNDRIIVNCGFVKVWKKDLVAYYGILSEFI